jgi:hypothetical protein
MMEPEEYVKKIAATGDVQKLNQILTHVYLYQLSIVSQSQTQAGIGLPGMFSMGMMPPGLGLLPV